MKKMNKVIAPLLGLFMILSSGAAVFADTAEQPVESEQRVLICEKEEHAHTRNCSVLICEREDHIAHEHVAACYEKKQQTCPYYTREEWVDAFGNDDEYQESYKYELDAETGEMTENAHVHGEGCYKVWTFEEPQCGKEEGGKHVGTCYKYGTCDVEEHTHSDSCYEVKAEEPPAKEPEENPEEKPEEVRPSLPIIDQPVIEEPDVPLAPLPEEPGTDEPTVDEPIIDEPDVPLAPAPDAGDEEGTVIDESDVPLASAADLSGAGNSDVPKTGDNAPLALLAGMILLSAGAIGTLGIRIRKEN